jgi:hypothetical protein
LAVLLGRYTHVKQQKYIDKKGRISRTSMPMTGWFSLLGASLPPVTGDVAQLSLLPGFLIDHTPRRYAVHIWNDLVLNSSELPIPALV